MAGLFGTQIGSLVRVVDGDTVWVKLRSTWLDIELARPIEIRLSGLNCAETRGVPDTAPGLAAKAYTLSWLMVAPNTLTVELRGIDKYGRQLGVISRPDGRELNGDLIMSGFAAPWDGTGPAPVPPWPPPQP